MINLNLNLDLSFKNYINKAKKVESDSSSSSGDSYIQLNDKSFSLILFESNNA